jgi:hypothetical protein
MQQSELVARLANAIVKYESTRRRSEVASREFYKLTAQEETYLLVRGIVGHHSDPIEQRLDQLERQVLECSDECKTLEEQTRQALQDVSRIGMLADGRSLTEIDAHFRKEDADEETTKKEIRHRIAESLDRNL